MHLQKLPDHSDISRIYQVLRDLPWPCWLDSGGGEYLDHGGRYHILAADPRERILSIDGITEVHQRDASVERTDRPIFEVLRHRLGRPRENASPLPFTGGAIGYCSYDFGRRLHGLSPVEGKIPEAVFGIYDWAVVHDLHECKTWLVGDTQLVPEKLLQCLNEVDARPLPTFSTDRVGKVKAHVSQQRYFRDFQRIQHYLREGDCYQVNYAQRFSMGFQGDVFALYLRMREQNPAPYGALLEFPFVQILSSSPEQFLHLDGAQVHTRPIKGTRPRAEDTARDEALANELAACEKDRAENLMIVDLLRNDLGRVCVPGSIEVPELFNVESYPTVHHLVSTVTGVLSEDKDALDLLQACFPGGSITGAPKRRAMEIIQELEASPRQVYCGSILRIGFDGNMDSNIAIRTLQLDHGRVSYHAGGGIVADSRADEEYQESLDKAAAFFRLFNKSAVE